MYGGLALSPGDEVLSTTHDFFSTEDSLRLLTKRTGAQVKRVTLYDHPAQATVDEMVARLVAGLTPRTKVVAVTWVHSSTGVRLPIEEISEAIDGPCAALRRRRARLRGGRRRPARPRLRLPVRRHPQVAVRTPGHRHPVGPRLGAAHRADPVVLRPRRGRPASPPAATTPSSTAGPSTEAFAFHQKVGRAAAVQRTVEQATQLKEGLAGRDGHPRGDAGGPEVSAGIVCLDVEGLPPGNGVYEPASAGHRGERDAVPEVVPPARPQHRHHARAGGRGGRGGRRTGLTDWAHGHRHPRPLR